MRSRVIALSTICLLLFGMFYLLLPTSAAADTWNGSITGGFTGNFDPAQRSVSCMTYFSVGGNNRLYAGTENDNGCRVYRYDGGSNWTQVNTDGFGNSNNTRATSMISYNGNLYVGTRNTSTGCEVWRYDGSNWTSYMLFGYLDRNNVDVSAMAEYSGVLYAGTENDSASGGSGCQVLAFSGVRLIWAQINTSGFGFTNNRRVSSMTAFNGSLVAGTENTGTGCQLWQYNGSAWGAAETNGFGDVNNSAATAMIQYDHGLGNRLYVGTHNNPNGPGVRGCQLWEVFGSWSSLTINMISTAGFGDGSNNSISSMAVFNDSGDKLFMGTASDWSGSNGCQIWTYDGSALNMPVTAGFGDPLNQGALAAATSDPGGGGALYFGTLNDPNSSDTDRGTGGEVWQYNAGGSVSQVNQNGFTSSNNYMVASMLRSGNDVFAGTASATGCEVWRYNGSWSQVSNDGFGDQNNSMASSMVLYDDGGGQKLYVGTYNPAGAQLWRFDGPGRGDWTRVSSSGDIESGGNRSISAMVAYPGTGTQKIYAGTYNNRSGCEVWSYDGTWSKLIGSGLPDNPPFWNGSTVRATSAVDAGGSLYFGILAWNGSGSQVWRLTLPGTWEQSDGSGFGNSNNQDVPSLTMYNGMLFAGTTNWSDGCGVFRHDVSGLTGWGQVNNSGFNTSNHEQIASSMCAGDNRLFVGTAYNCTVWDSYSADSPDSWSQANTNGFGNSGEQTVSAMTTRHEGLGLTIYAGTLNTSNGASVEATIPSVDSVSPAVGIQGQTMDVDISATNTHFNAGTSTCVFAPSDGITVNTLTVHSPTSATANISISDLATVGIRNVNVVTPGETPDDSAALFAVSAPGVPSIASSSPSGARQGDTLNLKIVGSNTHFVQGQSAATVSGTGIKVNRTTVIDVDHATANITVGLGAAVGARNVNVTTGVEIPTALRNGLVVSYGPKQAWYLAEGSTGANFETWILVQNPNDGGANINITYMTPNGVVQGPTEEIGPRSRKTYNVADTVPNTDQVSTMVTADRPIIAERSMYGNGRTWATDSIGIWQPAQHWFLAEGCTGPGFDTWVLVQNPSGSAATIQLTFMTSHGAVAGPRVTMPANTRQSFKVNNTCPGEWQVSTEVTSTQPVVAERAMYRTGEDATESIGTSSPQTQWYLPEGCTGPDFETWVLVQNPGEKVANVKLTYMTPSGQKAGPTLKLAPESRMSVNLANSIPGQWSVSTYVSSDQPIIAERAMYGNHRKWAHDSIGVSAPAQTWCLPEGCTGPGFETWVLVQNPNDTEAKVSLTYMTSDVSRDGPSVVLAPHTRKTFNVADTVGQVWEVSTKVTSDKPVIAERAMYGNGRIWGTDSIGCPW